MGAPIQDELAALPISRQRRYQLRKHRDGKCHICGQPAVNAWHCARHAVVFRENQRSHIGATRRNLRAASYFYNSNTAESVSSA